MTEDWRGRLERAIAETLRRRAARVEERRQLAEARDAGLAERHRQKLARAEPRGGRGRSRGRGATVEEESMPEVPPCCRDAEDQRCPQHEQAAGVVRHQGPRSRHLGGRSFVGEPGRAVPAPEAEES
jgi:hypothetical protein